MKKTLLTILMVVLLACACLFFAGCNNTQSNDRDKDILSIYNLYVANAEDNGQTPLSYEEWLESIKGEKGDKGEDGKTPTIEISEDGYWVINGEKTEYKAIGKDGANGENGTNGTNGIDGATIEKVEFDEQGRLVITLTDGTVLSPVEIPELHTFGEWKVFGDDGLTCEEKTFYRVCSKCNEMQFKRGSYLDHDWAVVTTKPTCQAQGYDTKTCEICGKVEKENYTPISDHDWEKEYRVDNSFHWIKCNDCEELKSKAEHQTDDSGYCTICGGAVGSTVGILYDLSSDGSYAEVIGYEGTAKNIIIASEYQGKPVKNIYKESFKNSSIKSVVIGDSVTSIGDNAFAYCSSLTSIEIGDSVTSISDFAFYDCHSLTSVVIPDSVTSIGSSAFVSCNNKLYTTENNLQYIKANGNPYFMLYTTTNKNLSTYTINNTTKLIGGSAFSGCSRLTSIEIPDSVTSISEYAFSSCNSLTSVNYLGTIDEWVQIKFANSTSSNNPLFYAKNLYINGELVTEVELTTTTKISNYAFSGCTSLTSVVIGDSVTSIGADAFVYCYNLTDIYCYAESQPSGWASDWKYGCYATVHWGYKGE